jgi:hypothetical protein
MYNKFNAFTYELIIFLCRFYPLKRKPFIQKILDYCLDDWAAFRAEVAMEEVDEQIKELHSAWNREQNEKQKPVYSEEKPDGSEAQKLLGGSMRLTSPWTSDKHEPSS